MLLSTTEAMKVFYGVFEPEQTLFPSSLAETELISTPSRQKSHPFCEMNIVYKRGFSLFHNFSLIFLTSLNI
jgi:hypothetical protein